VEKESVSIAVCSSNLVLKHDLLTKSKHLESSLI